MNDTAPASLPELIDRIADWPYGMPVRLMEQVLSIGAGAVPELIDALARWRDDEERDPLWLVVLLGETRHPDAVAPLVAEIARTKRNELSEPASEGLAKIGAAAIPALMEVARTGGELERLAAYLTLGWIRDERSYAALVDALGRDRALADVLAVALARQGRRQAVPAIEAAYRESEPWQRTDLENALYALEHDVPDQPAYEDDWRVRFRRVPDLGDAILPGQQVLHVLAHADPKLRDDGQAHPLRSLEEILADDEIGDEPEETCPDCGGVMDSYTGLPACPETAVSTAMFQLRLLDDAREDGIEDLFELLDELEGDLQDHLDAGEPRGPKARERWRSELEELADCRETCLWLIEQGVEEVGPAKAMLLAETGRLAADFGDPGGLLRPVETVRLAGPKVGRNDPCPCGSGRKYKHCCLDKA